MSERSVSQFSASEAHPEDSLSVEQHGVDVIPANERTSTLKDLFFVFVGSQMCFGIIVIGSLPVTFGLSFWNSVTSITAGLLVGSMLFALLAPFGARTGCSGSIASGAHFGVRGRVIGTAIAIFTGLGFTALTVWTGGEAIATAAARLWGWPITPNLLAVGAAIIGALVILVALIGHSIIVATERLVSYGVAAALVVVGISLFSGFHPSYAGGTPLLGSVGSTWFLSMAIAAALPVSYGIFLNDYTRYIPEDISSQKLMFAAGSGMFVGCWIALVFAAAVTTMFKAVDTPFVGGLVSMVAWWGVALLALVGIIGSQPQGSLCIYGAGLGLQTLFPRLGRIGATVVLSAVAMALVFAGIYGVNMANMIIAFLALDQCALAPWLVINLVGYRFVAKGRYQSAELFRFGERAGGQYWFSSGWNVNGLIAWAIGLIVGLMFVHTDFFAGPLSNLVGGVSLEWVFAGAVGGLVFYVLEKRNGRIA
ncbi:MULTISPECIES: cytosine permease [unclassified Caballeronia]|uniref:purine-cytosine permease family protein n=1 Tax=unclassified Caballeronia TaxID=2646786 RepID=UPI001F35C5BF|nr:MULTISPECIES: cytosine permease [unclassified Caballeronia]MCE4547302.1 cytosine permease [Caballeronia sp. PC1]MCE4575285.1 cytosine permease [Caballeronia sp. CLC5]MDR5749046.1 cytosine permease [Caballeronia sp. LZ029]